MAAKRSGTITTVSLESSEILLRDIDTGIGMEFNGNRTALKAVRFFLTV